MSRISKTILPAMALSLGTTALSAQTAPSPEDQMMEMMMDGLTSSESAPGVSLERQIENQILELMGEMESQPQAQSAEPLSIEEIDRLNRSAARERTELEFERARLERLQVEIDRLRTLYNAVRDINDAAAERERAERESTMEMLLQAQQMMGDDDEDDGDERGGMVELTPQQRELQQLPRIMSITGTGGSLEAAAEFDPLNVIDVSVGDQVMHGFTITDIKPNHVLLEGPQTGTIYRLTPRAVEDDVAPPPPPGAGEPTPAVNLGAGNMPPVPF